LRDHSGRLPRHDESSAVARRHRVRAEARWSAGRGAPRSGPMFPTTPWSPAKDSKVHVPPENRRLATHR
jgi:hypothetical protein